MFLFKDVKRDETVITERLYGKAGIRFLRESVDVMIREFGKEAGAFLVEDDCIDGVYRTIAEGKTRPLWCLFDCVAFCTAYCRSVRSEA